MADGWKYVDDDPKPSDPSGGQQLSVYHESLWERFKDHFEHATREDQLPGVNQAVNFLADKLQQGNSLDKGSAIQNERDYREQYDLQGQDDPFYKSKDGAIPTGMAALAGDVAGGLTNPLNLIGGEGTRLLRMGKQGLISAGSDIANQGLDLAQGVRDKFSGTEAMLSGLVGTLFGAAGRETKGVRATDHVDPLVNPQTGVRVAPEVEGQKFIGFADDGNGGFAPQYGDLSEAPKGPPASANDVGEEGTRASGLDKFRDMSSDAALIVDNAKRAEAARQAYHDAQQDWLNYTGNDQSVKNDLHQKVMDAGDRLDEVHAANRKAFSLANNDEFPSSARAPAPYDPVVRGNGSPDAANYNDSSIKDLIAKQREGESEVVWDPTADHGAGAFVEVDTGRSLVGNLGEKKAANDEEGSKIVQSDGRSPVVRGNVSPDAANANDVPNLPVLSNGGAGRQPPVPPSEPPAGSPPGGGGIDGGAIPPGGNGPAPETDKGKFAANINLQRLATDEEQDDILRQVATHLKLDNQTHAETIADAREGLRTESPAEIILHNPTLEEATSYALKLRTTLVTATRRMHEAAESVLDPSVNSEDAFQRLQLLRVTVAAAAEKTSKVAGQSGRLLNQFNIIAGDDHKGVAAALKNLDEMVGQKVDPKTFAQAILIHRDNQAAQAQIARDSFKPHWEDYGLSLWYNAMLSGPWTHIRNMAGNAISGLQDITAQAGAAAIGSGRRLAGAEARDVKTWGEVGQMIAGGYHALVDSATYKNTAEAFRKGANLGIKGELHHADLGDLIQGKSGATSLTHKTLEALSTPTKALEAEDEFWRNLFTSASYYGEAHAQAKKEGLTGQDYTDRVANLVQNPTDKMDSIAEEYGKRLQFRDEPGWLGKLANYARNGVTKGKNTGIDRTVKTAASIIMPFSRVTDNTIRHVVRYSPFGFADRTNLADIKAGGKRRDMAVSRMATGTAGLMYILSKVSDGTFTGDGPDDYRKRAEMQAEGWQPNSVKIGGKYYGLNGLAPLANQVNILANLSDHYKAGKFTDQDYLTNVLNAGRDFVAQLNNNNFTQDLGNLFSALGTGPEADGAAKVYLGNLASSITTPAILRQSEQTFGDTGVQDLTGNGSVGDYVKNRAAQYYGKDLPQKYDALGNPVVRNEGGVMDRIVGQTRSPSDDSAVKELTRLSLKDTALITPAPKTIDRDGYKVKLDSEEYEKYQFMAGQNFMNNLRLRMKSPDWSTMSDADKRSEVKSMMKDARSDARDSLKGNGWSYVE